MKVESELFVDSRLFSIMCDSMELLLKGSVYSNKLGGLSFPENNGGEMYVDKICFLMWLKALKKHYGKKLPAEVEETTIRMIMTRFTLVVVHELIHQIAYSLPERIVGRMTVWLLKDHGVEIRCAKV